jgi:hypothetical protein
MSDTDSKKKPPLPHWWEPDLYNYVETMSLHGWVWEFMRRSKLKRILKGRRPVGAMNPRGGVTDGGTKERRKEICWLSLTWHLASTIPVLRNKLLTLPPAITMERVCSDTSSELRPSKPSYIENAIGSAQSKPFV